MSVLWSKKHIMMLKYQMLKENTLLLLNKINLQKKYLMQ